MSSLILMIILRRQLIFIATNQLHSTVWLLINGDPESHFRRLSHLAKMPIFESFLLRNKLSPGLARQRPKNASAFLGSMLSNGYF